MVDVGGAGGLKQVLALVLRWAPLSPVPIISCIRARALSLPPGTGVADPNICGSGALPIGGGEEGLRPLPLPLTNNNRSLPNLQGGEDGLRPLPLLVKFVITFSALPLPSAGKYQPPLALSMSELLVAMSLFCPWLLITKQRNLKMTSVIHM